MIDVEGHVWLLDVSNKLYYENNNSLHHYGYTSNYIPYGHVPDVHVDKAGVVWYAHGDIGLGRHYDDTWDLLTVDDGLSGNAIYDITSGDDGSLWVGTSNGVSKYDGDNWTSYTVEDGLPVGTATAVTVDSDGRCWVCFTNRVAVIDGNDVARISASSITGIKINDITTHGNDIWYSTSTGVIRYHNGKYSTYNTIDGLQNRNVVSIMVSPSGEVFAATYESENYNAWLSISRFDRQDSWISLGVFPAPYANYFSNFALAAGADGEIYTMVAGQLWVLHDKLWRIVSQYNARALSVALGPNDDIWFGTETGLLWYHDPELPLAVDDVMPQQIHDVTCYPNPFNAMTTISFTVSEPGRHDIFIYNISGQKVYHFTDSYPIPGRKALVWDGRDDRDASVSSGIYFIRVTAPDYQTNARAIMLR